MTNETLEEYIRIYNSSNWQVPMSKFQISPNIELALIWTELPSGLQYPEDSYRFFFISNNTECVAIVLEMGVSNLHWFVLEKYRKKGFLHKALKDYIFPYLFSDGRSEQCATADSAKNEEYLKRQGFKERIVNNHKEFYLHKSIVKENDMNNINRNSLSDGSLKNLKYKLRKMAGEIRIIRDQVECGYGDDCGLEDLASILCSISCDIEDLNLK